jgi:hypothetical protein
VRRQWRPARLGLDAACHSPRRQRERRTGVRDGKYRRQTERCRRNRKRAANEPLSEITQIKGTSETHPDPSPNDESAGFEQWGYTLWADGERPTPRRGSFAGEALLDRMSQDALGNGKRFKPVLRATGKSDAVSRTGRNELTRTSSEGTLPRRWMPGPQRCYLLGCSSPSR